MFTRLYYYINTMHTQQITPEKYVQNHEVEECYETDILSLAFIKIFHVYILKWGKMYCIDVYTG